MVTKPILKWVGGKTQILDQVLELIPDEMRNYHEPFVGGGSVLLGVLSQKKAEKMYASDLNANLIYMYKNIQSEPEELISELRQLSEEYHAITGTIVNRKATTFEEAQSSQESYYYWIRNRFNTIEDKASPLASAMLIFLNKTCFRGIYREGPNGFNVPFGNYKNPTILDEPHIREVSILIKPVVFTHQSFQQAFESIQPDDFVYIDPPYVPETATSFVSYTKDGFNDHECLFELFKQTKGLMSNSDVPLVRQSFVDYKIKTISCRRAIHSKKPDSRTNELLIINL